MAAVAEPLVALPSRPLCGPFSRLESAHSRARAQTVVEVEALELEAEPPSASPGRLAQFQYECVFPLHRRYFDGVCAGAGHGTAGALGGGTTFAGCRPFVKSSGLATFLVSPAGLI